MRLINAGDAYIVLVDEYHLRSVAQSYALMEALDKVPTVDAVPVVRCKDCKHHEPDTYCHIRDGLWHDTDYCSRAERKEECD